MRLSTTTTRARSAATGLTQRSVTWTFAAGIFERGRTRLSLVGAPGASLSEITVPAIEGPGEAGAFATGVTTTGGGSALATVTVSLAVAT